MSLSDVFLGRPDLLADENKLKSVLADHYSGDTPKINRMMKAYEMGVVTALTNGNDIDLEKKKIINRMVDLHDMQESKAADAVSEWSSVCTTKVIAAYKAFLQAEKKSIEVEKEKEERKKEKQSKEYLKRKEQEEAERKAAELKVNLDDYNRYYNLDLTKGTVVYGVPCGVGNSDYGFTVKGTDHWNKELNHVFPSVHALVYNILIRDAHI